MDTFQLTTQKLYPNLLIFDINDFKKEAILNLVFLIFYLKLITTLNYLNLFLLIIFFLKFM